MRRWWTDVEPAYEHAAECDCHDNHCTDNCACVTSADVETWNAASSAVSALTAEGVDLDALASASQLISSADVWNSTTETVSSNSAYWSELSAVSSQTETALEDLSYRLDELSGKKIYTDDSISGDGTEHWPYGVTYLARIDALIEQYENLTASTNDLRELRSCDGRLQVGFT